MIAPRMRTPGPFRGCARIISRRNPAGRCGGGVLEKTAQRPSPMASKAVCSAGLDIFTIA
jgi:hypothetical protein